MTTCTIDEILEIIKMFAQPNAKIDSSTNLLGDKAIDSINTIQIIVELERRFNLTLSNMELTFDDFLNPIVLHKSVVRLIKNQKK